MLSQSERYEKFRIESRIGKGMHKKAAAYGEHADGING